MSSQNSMLNAILKKDIKQLTKEEILMITKAVI